MAKKTKKPISETMVKSILEDLQNENELANKKKESSALGQAILQSSPNPTRVVPQTRVLPEGLSSESAIFGPRKPEAEASSENEVKESSLWTPSISQGPAIVKVGDIEISKPDGIVAFGDSESSTPSFEPLVLQGIELPPTPQSAGLNDANDENSKTGPVSQDHAGEATQQLLDSSQTRRLDESSSVTFNRGGGDSSDRTQPMIRHGGMTSPSDASTKVSHGFSRPLTKSSASLAASVTEAQMLQAENLRMAQSRILELEKEVETLRQENELLASAGEIAKKRAEELFEKISAVERVKIDELEHAQMEMNIYRENLVEKDKELGRMRQKIEDLESRLAKDLKKIRVRERELENRLELSKMEKTALVRSKDDAILDLKNKVDHLFAELENYKHKCADLGQKVDGQHDQLGRTVRALRLALTHLEANDTSGTVTPFKKAE
ncbi:MAG: hypothetical protein ACK5P7_13730 [Bdellovibrio sp.]|jgi:hypothetical protein